MTDALSLSGLIRASIGDAGRMIIPSLPWTGLFMAMWTYLFWFAASYPEGGVWTLIFFGLALVTLFTHSLFSVSLYSAVLPHQSGVLKAGWKLTLAWLLVITVLAIILSGIALFYGMVAGSIAAVIGVEAQTTRDVTSQVFRDPTITILFLTIFPFLLWIFWFVTRLMTFAAATSVRAQVHVFRTWSWTKGQFKTLGPALLILVFAPLMLAAGLSTSLNLALFGQDTSATALALQSGLAMLAGVPVAWLGHALAANVYKTVADQGHITES